MYQWECRRGFKNGIVVLLVQQCKGKSTLFNIKCEKNGSYIIVELYHKFLYRVQHKTSMCGKCSSNEISESSNTSKCHTSFTKNSPPNKIHLQLVLYL